MRLEIIFDEIFKMNPCLRFADLGTIHLWRPHGGGGRGVRPMWTGVRGQAHVDVHTEK